MAPTRACTRRGWLLPALPELHSREPAGVQISRGAVREREATIFKIYKELQIEPTRIAESLGYEVDYVKSVIHKFLQEIVQKTVSGTNSDNSENTSK